MIEGSGETYYNKSKHFAEGGPHTAMKKFLRRMNRGVALAIVLVIGLAVCLTVESVRFEGEREVIRARVEGLLADASGLNVFPDEYNVPGAQLPEDVKQRQKDRIAEVRERYGFPYGSAYQWEGLTDSAESRDPGRGIIYSERYTAESLNKIRPQGSGYASAELEFSYTAEYAGWQEFWSVLGHFGYPPSEELEEYRWSGKEPETVDLSRRMRYTVEGAVRLELVRKDSVWMIRSAAVRRFSEQAEEAA